MTKHFNEIAKQWYKYSHKLECLCIVYLIRILSKNKGKIYWDSSDLREYISVTYNGGNHPEYASNAFSTVNGVYINSKGIYVSSNGVHINSGDIYLDTEDCSSYSIAEISLEELHNLCMFLDEHKEEIGFK